MEAEFQNVGDLYMGIYDSVVYPPLFFLALVVIPPIFEESLFRGFLFRGIQAKQPQGWAGAAERPSQPPSRLKKSKAGRRSQLA